MAKPPITVRPSDCLNEDGSFPDEAQARSRAIRIAQCVEAGGPLEHGCARSTLVPCRRRPDGAACLGMLWVFKQADDAIVATCSACGADDLLIVEWEDTDWAQGPMPPVHVEERMRELDSALPGLPAEEEADEDDELDGDDDDDELQRELWKIGSSLSAARVRELIATADEPMVVLAAVIDAAASMPDRAAVEAFMPIFMAIWNATPRPDEDGVK